MKKGKDILNFENDKSIGKLMEKDEVLIFSGVVTKFNKLNWKQERNMVITNKHIMNLKKKSLQRKIKITAVEAITKSTNKESTEFVLHIPSEYDYRYLGDLRNDIIQIIKEQYAKQCGKNVPIYGVPHLLLKDFVTTKADRKKNNFKIPDEGFLMKEENILSEADLKKGMIDEIPMFEKMKGVCIFQKEGDPKKMQIEEFRVIQRLRKGRSGFVFLAENKVSGKHYAVKEVKGDKMVSKDISYEKHLELLKGVKHPFIVDIEYVFSASGKLYIFSKHMRGELYNLFTKEKHLTETQCKFYAAQLIMALQYLHTQNIVHRDAKIEKVMLAEDGYVGLLSSSMSKIILPEKKSLSFVGTPDYLAPEIINGEGHDRSVDWWILGILVYEMLVGITPFFDQNDKALFNNIVTAKVRFPDPEKSKIALSDKAKDLIEKLLSKKPKERLGSGPKDGEEILMHPFFEGLTPSILLEKKIKADYIPPLEFMSLENFDTSLAANESGISPSKLELIQKFEEEFKSA